MNGVYKEIEDKILNDKSTIDILFMVYRLQEDSFTKSLYDTIKDLDKSKYNIQVVVLCKSDCNMNFGVDIQYLYESEYRFWECKLKNNFNFYLDKQYDIVISYSCIITAEIISKLDINIFKLAYIHGDFMTIHKGYTMDYLRDIYKNINTIMCTTEDIKISVIDSLGKELVSNISTIYDQVDSIDIYSKKDESEDKEIDKEDTTLNIVSVGRLNHDKGFDKLIRVHKKLIDEGIKNTVRVLGEGSERGYFENLININNVKETFILEGYKENPYECIKDADLFVLASDSEGLPLVIMESMILHKPIVATNVNGTRELLKDGYGMLVENSDKGLYSGIKKMALSKDLRESYVNKLKSVNQFKFDKEIIVPEIENLFDRYIKKENSKKINILIVVHIMAGGGCEKSLINLLDNIDYNKYNIDVIILIKQMGDVYNFNPNANIKYVFENLNEFDRKYNKDYIYPLNKIYDLEIAYSDVSSIEFLLKNGNYHANKIAWVHGDISYLGLFKSKEYLIDIYEKMAAIVCVSKDTKDRLIEFLGISIEPKMEVIYNLMPIDEIRGNKYTKSNPFNILAISRLSYEKGIDRLIRIHRRLLDEGVYNHLKIVGDGYEKSNLENLIKELGVSDTCKICGYIKNPYPYIENSDLIVSPSRQEGFGLVIAEAMVLEKPIIATETHGSKELLEYKYGLITLNDDQDLYIGMKNIINDDYLRQCYVDNIKTINKFKFNKDIGIKKLNDLINVKEGKVRILVTILAFWGGGAEASLINILNNLDYDKYDIDLLTLIKSDTNIDLINKNVNKLPFVYDTEEDAYKDLIKDKPDFEMDEVYDVEIAYLGRPTIEVITKCSKSQSKKISWLHGTINFTIAGSNIEYIQNLYSKIDKIVCVSEGVEKELIDNIKVDVGDKCCVINPILDEEYIKFKSNLSSNSSLIYTLPFYIDKNKNFKEFLEMATDCIKSIERCKFANIIIYNQGGLTNEELAKFMSQFNISFTILGNGMNDGIAFARYMMLKYILKEYKHMKYLAEIHLDMIFSENWEVPIINRLDLSDEPMMCANIIYYDTESNKHVLNSDNKYIDFSGDLEAKINILKSNESYGIIEKFTHPVIHKIDVLEAINAYDIGFLIGKQGYEDDSLLLGYSYYMGTKNKWVPKSCLESCVYHKVCAQRFDIEDKYNQWELNNKGLKSQYGAYGQKELARMRGEYYLRFIEEYESMILDKNRYKEKVNVGYKKEI